MVQIACRNASVRSVSQLIQNGVSPLLARLYAARGIEKTDELDYRLSALLLPQQMKGCADAAICLADAIEADARLLIIGDYDCDGATATAVAIRALRQLGANVDYLVPDRFRFGYGLSPAIVDLAATNSPDLIITVDNGIASVEGVDHARELGISVLVTDHHLPGDILPMADCIVNPNQPGCTFPDKHMAGVGVIFYVMLALRAELRARGFFADHPDLHLGSLLDLVALGTVADVVRLGHNNRILVSQGLQRIRSGQMHAGIAALFKVAGRDPAKARVDDLGFRIAPRLNAAGRLDDMRLGIECLLCDDETAADSIVAELDRMNRERQEIESTMREQAEAHLAREIAIGEQAGIALFNPLWHEGVIGILASRIREKTHRPVFAFAKSTEAGVLKGSGRSIPGVHLRDALDLISKRYPDLLLRFGGHAMAAGLSLREENFSFFQKHFDSVVDESLDPQDKAKRIDVDGSLDDGALSLATAQLLQEAIWGQGFPSPLFVDDFSLQSQHIIKEKHLKMRLQKDGQAFDAMQFNFQKSPTSKKIRVVYHLDVNEFRGRQSLQLLVSHWEALEKQVDNDTP